MDIGVEISLYPLKADFVPAIHEFLERLNRAAGLRIVTNSMSTQVFGPFEQVMELLRRVLKLRNVAELSVVKSDFRLELRGGARSGVLSP